jgi:hypothetical protein
MIAALRAARLAAHEDTSGRPRYTEYPSSQGVGHSAWIPAAQDTGLAPWVFARARTTTAPILRNAANHLKVKDKPSLSPAIDGLGRKDYKFPLLKVKRD